MVVSHKIKNKILSMKTSTLQHVPKGARDIWAEVVGEPALRSITNNPSDLDPWRLFFMLPRCVLANPVRGGGGAAIGVTL